MNQVPHLRPQSAFMALLPKNFDHLKVFVWFTLDLKRQVKIQLRCEQIFLNFLLFPSLAYNYEIRNQAHGPRVHVSVKDMQLTFRYSFFHFLQIKLMRKSVKAAILKNPVHELANWALEKGYFLSNHLLTPPRTHFISGLKS